MGTTKYEFSRSMMRSDKSYDKDDSNLRKPTKPRFTYFPNHGDEEGNNCYTIIYGNIEENGIIVATTNTEEDAQEGCARLNSIIDNI